MNDLNSILSVWNNMLVCIIQVIKWKFKISFPGENGGHSQNMQR
ncbi:hypothetical protein QQ020_31310 [Fulvivirgaceae bacterium BMA12]|uniref:Uncharacterized protein n=1 Tax=Agaribacillus aureus TaxID=3051825 RepID=A0ABT8LFP2_9BACT|nr:hypothetical protein [Fulvivirgaceae bacterium BMA12]